MTSFKAGSSFPLLENPLVTGPGTIGPVPPGSDSESLSFPRDFPDRAVFPGEYGPSPSELIEDDGVVRSEDWAPLCLSWPGCIQKER